MKKFYSIISGILIVISMAIIRPVSAANLPSGQETNNDHTGTATIQQNPFRVAPVNKDGVKNLRSVSQINVFTPSYPVGIKSGESLLVPYSLEESGNVSGEITSRTFQYFTQYDVPLSEVIGPYPASIEVRSLQQTEWNELIHVPEAVIHKARSMNDYAVVLKTTFKGRSLSGAEFKTQTTLLLLFPPNTFSKDTPQNGAINQSNHPSLHWNSSVGAVDYEYCIDTSNNNHCDANWNGTYWLGTYGTDAALTNLPSGTTLYWQVRANNPAGSTYANNGMWWSFTTLPDTYSIYYVDSDANGANNGSSWADAYTDLQSAISAASAADEIWVAAGTYKPTPGTDRTVSFVLKNGVAIYGGFAGNETLRTQRNSELHVTTLSGDIGIQGDNSDNSNHVLIGSNTSDAAVLDGFTVTAGNGEKGGGMFNNGGSPSIKNVTFINNSATVGGGMYNGNEYGSPYAGSSKPILVNVKFIANSAVGGGGGMRNENYSSPTLINVLFKNNVVTRTGGGMENFYYSSPNLTNVVFEGNTAFAGGGMFNWVGDNPVLKSVTFKGNTAEWGGGMGNYQSSASIVNSTFYGNTATAYGGALYNEYYSGAELVNVTMSNNSAVTHGGGIYNDSFGSSVEVRNSIIYDNSGGEIYNAAGTNIVHHSIIKGGYTGTGNLDLDPLLGPLQDNGGFTETMALLPGSPAINSGTNVVCPTTDQRGVSRSDGACDIGAYEYPAPIQDDFDAPVVIPNQPYLYTVDVSGATQHTDDPTVSGLCDGEMLAKGRASVWYKYIPSASANVSLDTLGSNYDTYIAVWTGTRNNLSLVGCDNNTATNSQSQLSLFLTAGTPYFIEVAEYAGASPAANRSLTLHATTFADVPGNHVFWRYIEGFYTRRITNGCGANPFSYCPDAPVNRAAMAVFILRAKYGSSHVPDPIQTNLFSDLPIAGQEWMQPWIEEFYEEGVTTGCGVSPRIYCPQSPVTREAMAVFLLRAKYGAGYTPPPASNPPLFADVPVAGKEWMQPWIEEFYRQGYTTGCGASPLIYCPSATVNRAAMAVFISRVFNIPQVP